MRESVDHLVMLKRNLAAIAGAKLLFGDRRIATGNVALDEALGGGLGRGRVHELFAANGDGAGSVTGFATMLALRTVGRRSPIFWIRTDESERLGGRLHGPGLVELGGDPDSLVLGVAPDTKALLKAAADAARCPGLSALIVECHGQCPALDLTASRRLALAAEQSGATLFLIRLEAQPVPSAADTRWRVGAAPSRSLEAGAPGLPMFEIELLRRRAGPAGMRWHLEWHRDRLLFADPALSGDMVPLSAGRPSAPSNRGATGLRLSA
jgi:protein ImuA